MFAKPILEGANERTNSNKIKVIIGVWSVNHLTVFFNFNVFTQTPGMLIAEKMCTTINILRKSWKKAARIHY